MNETDTLAIKLTGDATGYDSALRQAEAETVRASAAIGTAYDKGFDKAASSAQQAGQQMTAAMAKAGAAATGTAARMAQVPRLPTSTTGGIAGLPPLKMPPVKLTVEPVPLVEVPVEEPRPVKVTADTAAAMASVRGLEAESLRAAGAISTTLKRSFHEAATSSPGASRQIASAATAASQAAQTAAAQAGKAPARPTAPLAAAVKVSPINVPLVLVKGATAQLEAEAKAAASTVGTAYAAGYGKAEAAAVKARTEMEKPPRVPAAAAGRPTPGAPTGMRGSPSPATASAAQSKAAAAAEKDAAKQAAQSQKDAARETEASWKATWGAVRVARNLALAYVAFKVPFAIKDFIDSTVELGTAARRVGADILEVRAGMLWAGVTAESMTAAIGTTTATLDAFRAGSVQAARDLENLAAVSGMSVAEISGSFVTVYEAIARIQDPTVRATQAFRLLGSEADKFLDALAKAGPGESMNVAKRFGLEVSPADLANLREIQTTVRQIQGIGTGAFNQILLGISPIVAELSSAFELTKVNLEWIKPLVIKVAHGIGLFGAFIIEASGNSKLLTAAMDAVWAKAEQGALLFKSAMLDSIAEIIQSLNPLKTALGGIGSMFGKETGLAMEIGADALGSVATGSLKKDADRARADAEAAGKRSGKKVGEVIEQTKASDIGKKVDAFFERVDKRSSKDKKDEAKPKDNVGTATLNTTLDKFKGVVDGLRGPIDEWRQGIVDMKQFEASKLYAGKAGQDTKLLQAAGMFEKLRQGAGLQATTQLAGAAEGGTKEAYSAVAQYAMLGQRGSVQDQMKQALDVANQQREAQLELGRESLAAMRDLAREGKLVEPVSV
jgi:hypothetical protein